MEFDGFQIGLLVFRPNDDLLGAPNLVWRHHVLHLRHPARLLGPVLLYVRLLERLLLEGLLERLLLEGLREGLLLLLLEGLLLLLLMGRLMLLLLLFGRGRISSANDYFDYVILVTFVRVDTSGGSGVAGEVTAKDAEFFFKLVVRCTRDFGERWILGELDGTNPLRGSSDGAGSSVSGGHDFLEDSDVLIIGFLLLKSIDNQFCPGLVSW